MFRKPFFTASGAAAVVVEGLVVGGLPSGVTAGEALALGCDFGAGFTSDEAAEAATREGDLEVGGRGEVDCESGSNGSLEELLDAPVVESTVAGTASLPSHCSLCCVLISIAGTVPNTIK